MNFDMSQLVDNSDSFPGCTGDEWSFISNICPMNKNKHAELIRTQMCLVQF